MTTSRIKKEAARRLIELETATDREACRADLERWFSEDPQHRAAFESIEQAWKAVDDLKILHMRGGGRSESGYLSKRPLLAACAILFVAGVTCAYFLFQPAKRVPPPAAYWEKYSTDYGETKLVELSGGSLIQMNANTQIKVNRAAMDGEVLVDKGEAWFDVRHNPSRPFRVRAGLTSVNVLGTTFSVWRKTDAETVTLVKEGRVKVIQPSHEAKEVAADETAVAGPDGVEVTEVDPKTIERMLSWQKGVLAFDGQTLTEVVAAFNRFNREKLKIDDPRIAQRRIGGTYSARNPRGFAELLERTFGIHYFVESRADVRTQVIHLSLATP